MWFPSWLRNWTSTRAARTRAHRRPAAGFRPRLELLEDRTVPSTIPLTVNTLADGSGAGNLVTLRDAITLANKHPDKTYEIDITKPGTIQLESSLPDLANNITIKGLGTTGTNVTVIQRDASKAPFRLLTVDAGETVAISGLSLSSGDAGSGDGGAIDNKGTLLTLDSCTLSGNSAANGGAVENEAGATLSVLNCNLLDNQAGSYTGTPGFGGGIDNKGTLTVSGGSIRRNFATDGGGIYNTGTLQKVSSCFFESNSASHLTLPEDHGGAIDNNGPGTVQVTGCTFNNNYSDNHAGGIYNAAGDTLVVTGCHFNDNHTAIILAPSPSFLYRGGAIENAGTLTVTDSKFFHNRANPTYGSGGAISNLGTANVSQTSFGDGTNAGANSAAYGGAIINWGGASLNLDASAHFNDNSATNSGGAIWNYGTLVDNGASYTLNSAAYGGAIINWGGAFLTLNAGASFDHDSVTGSGGAIWNYGTLVDNGASYTNNSASFYGGAIYNAGGAGLTATGASFTNNTALDGGAIINYFDATVSGCTFTSNHSTGSSHDYDGGGAIWNSGMLAVLGGSTFSGNTAVVVGGAIFNSGAATVTQTSFTGNNHAMVGGAIMNWQAANLTINPNTTFSGNTADLIGGAIENDGTLTATGASFNGNTAASRGGAIENFGTMTVSGGSFWYNHADSGGAISNFGVGSLSGAGYAYNWATSGGAIFNAAVLTVTGCQIEHNTASSDGGGIDNFLYATLDVQGCEFLYNRATYGGGIFNEANAYTTGKVTVSNSAFYANTPDNIFGPWIDGGGNIGI